LLHIVSYVARERMIRTICSSFLFLLPVYISHVQGDTFHLMLFTVAMGISIANHSHTFHKDKIRRSIFCGVDCCFMAMLAIYSGFDTIYRQTMDSRLACFLAALNIFLFRQFGHKYIEDYTETQRKWHVVFHFSAILTLTVSRYGISSISSFF